MEVPGRANVAGAPQFPNRKAYPFGQALGSLTEYHFLAFGAQLGDELFSLRGGEVGHCVLDEHPILPVVVGVLIDLNSVDLSADGAVDFNDCISHGISSFLFCTLIIAHERGFVNPFIQILS